MLPRQLAQRHTGSLSQEGTGSITVNIDLTNPLNASDVDYVVPHNTIEPEQTVRLPLDSPQAQPCHRDTQT